MRPVLKDPSASGPDPVYTVYKDLENSWINKTELADGLYGDEFPKTFGHYHADGKDEIYKIESGSGLLLLQSDTNVFLITVKSGERIKIPHQYGHAWINIGDIPLVSYDDHKDPQDNYEPVAIKHGLAYYVISDHGQPKAVVNPNYVNPPSPQWLTAEEFNGKQS